MIVNRLIQNVEKMWRIQAANDNKHLWYFDGYSRTGNEDIIVEKYIYNLKEDYPGDVPDFLFLNSGVVVISEKLKDSKLWWVLAMGSEMIPIYINGLDSKFYICNITYCPNAINYTTSIMEAPDENDERNFVKLYLKPDWIGGTINVIKLANDASKNIYVLQNRSIGSDMVKICNEMNIEAFSFQPLIKYNHKVNGQYEMEMDFQTE